MIRRTIFHNYSTGEELVMPVMPADFKISTGRKISNIDMAACGEVNVVGLETLLNEQQTFWLPSNQHPAAVNWQDPYSIVQTLTEWSLSGDVIGYIIYGTPVNQPVVIESVEISEEDGTNDVYVTITIKGYRFLSAEQTVSRGNNARSDAEGSKSSDTQSYIVQNGDTLWAICLKYYGDGSLAYKLAGYNGVKNANLIYAGDVLKIPGKAELSSAVAVYGSSIEQPTAKNQPGAVSDVSAVTVSKTGKTNAIGRVDVTYTDLTGIQRTVTNPMGPIKAKTGTRIMVRANDGASGSAKSLSDASGSVISGYRAYNATVFTKTASGNDNISVFFAR